VKILESYKKIAKSMLIEHAWDRKFGEPLPTLEDVMREAEVDDKKMIKYKDKDGEAKEMPAGSAKTMEKDHPAKIAYDKMADTGGEEEPKSKGLEPDDFERDFDDDEPKGGGDFTKSADYDMWSDDEPKDEPKGDEEPSGEPEGGEEPEGDLGDGEDYSKPPDDSYDREEEFGVKPGSLAGDSNLIKNARSLFPGTSLDWKGSYKKLKDAGHKELVNALKSNIPNYDKIDLLKHAAAEPEGGEKEESITINGKKYRPIKESVEPKKHLLREMYERIGGK
jgi:hypothetical protein